MKLLSVVIPVYNEKDTIREILARVQAVDIGLDKEIVVVDDASGDGSGEILQEYEGRPGFTLNVWIETAGRAPPFVPALSLQKAISSLYRTPIWNMIPKTIPDYWRRFFRVKPMWSTDHASWGANRTACFSSGIRWQTRC